LAKEVVVVGVAAAPTSKTTQVDVVAAARA
jgi:hypothetical protein